MSDSPTRLKKARRSFSDRSVTPGSETYSEEEPDTNQNGNDSMESETSHSDVLVSNIYNSHN